MQCINIFLASSINDLHDERLELGNYIRILNDLYQDKEVYFRLHMCEDMSDEIAQKRSQDVYNDVIRSCDYFYIMCWHKAGEYTLEEFDVALEQFKNTGAPKITAFFKQTEGDPTEEVRKFMVRLNDELSFCYTVFDDINIVKLKILLEMTQRPGLQAQVTCEDAKLKFNGREIKDINIEKTPFYANHDRIKELRAEIEELDKKLMEIRLKMAATPKDDNLFSELLKISGEKSKAEEELHKIEMELLKLASRVVEMSANGEYLTARAKEALRLFDQGKVKEAMAILDDEERRRDAERSAERLEENKKDFQGYVKEYQLRISNLKSEDVTQR